MTPSSLWEVGLKAEPFTGLKGDCCLTRQTRTDDRRRRRLLMVPAGKPVRVEDLEFRRYKKRKNPSHQKLLHGDIVAMMTDVLRT